MGPPTICGLWRLEFESRAIPGLRIETRGTQRCGEAEFFKNNHGSFLPFTSFRVVWMTVSVGSRDSPFENHSAPRCGLASVWLRFQVLLKLGEYAAVQVRANVGSGD